MLQFLNNSLSMKTVGTASRLDGMESKNRKVATGTGTVQSGISPS